MLSSCLSSPLLPSSLTLPSLSSCLPLPFGMCPSTLSFPSSTFLSFLCPFPLRDSHPSCILPKFYHTAVSLFCWVATFKVLKFNKSVIVCPNLERKSSRNNKPEKQNVLQKSPSWRILSGHNMTVDKEWRKLVTELPIIIYWVFRAVSDWDEQDLIHALEDFKYSTENTVCSYVTLIKAECVRSWFIWQPLTPTLQLELWKTQKWIPHGLHPQGT